MNKEEKEKIRIEKEKIRIETEKGLKKYKHVYEMLHDM